MAFVDESAKRLRRLAEVVEKIAAVHDIASLFAIVRHAVRELTGADGVTLVLRDNGQCYYADEDSIGPLWKGQRFPLEACISGWSMLHAEPAVIEDIYADPRIPHAAYRSTFVKSLSMVPVGRKDPVGAIGCYWASLHKASSEELELQQALADAMSVGLANIDLYQKLETARQVAEQAAAEAQASKQALQAAQRLAAVGNWEWDTKTDKHTWSEQVYFIYGRDPTLPPAAYPEVQQYFTSDSWARLAAAVEQGLEEGVPYECDAEVVRPDGSHRWVVARGEAVRDSDGNIVNMHGTVQDITQRKQAEGEIRQLNAELERRVDERTAKLAAVNRAKDSFLATMSHEIRTPLTGMLGMLELLSFTPMDEDQHSTLDAAWDSGRGLLRIVSDILDWSKIEEGKLELAPCPTSIPQLLQEVVNTYSRIASAKSITLSQHSDTRLGSAHIVDPLRLSQMLNNFVSNAIKFTQHGSVEVRAELVEKRQDAERVRFSVRDTGIGIAKDAQEQLFQRYQQGSADTARMYGGTGLGLSICRRLAEMMDGAIELKSEQGLGSIFSIELKLPLAAAPVEKKQSSHPEVKQRAVKPLFAESETAPLVLAVDDTPINRNLLARQVRMLGMRVETAENGEAALSMWRSGNFSLVITDCHMPEMDGYALTREIRRIEAEESRARTPVIAWTANALAEESGRCHAADMDDLLVKPTDMAQLRNTMVKWLSIPDSRHDSFPKREDGSQQTPAPIDHSVLSLIIADSTELGQLLQDFQSQIRDESGLLSKMLELGDLDGVGSTAHRMKGSSRMVGASYLAKACEDIELAARNGDKGAARDASIVLRGAICQVETYLANSTFSG